MSSLEEEIEKLSPEEELVEYFIQYREEDLNKLTPKSKFKINITENKIFPIILEETREQFRKTIRIALLKAFAKYKIDEGRFDLISKIKEVFSDIIGNILFSVIFILNLLFGVSLFKSSSLY